MFADYRVPQILSTLGCISYSPPLGSAIQEKRVIESGSKWEMQLRGKFCNFLVVPKQRESWLTSSLQPAASGVSS